MADKITLAELNIDTDKLLKELTDVKKSIKDLTDEQKKLKASGDETSETFVQNETKLKTLKATYNAQQKVLKSVTDAEKRLTNALKAESKSIDQATKNNKELREIRNQVNTSTEEGKKKIEEINAKIDENNALIKANSSALEQQKQNIGNYKSALDLARGATRAFGAALKAAGIGLVVAAVGKLTEAFGRNQKVADAFGAIINGVNIVLDDFIELVVNGFVDVQEFFKSVFEDPKEKVEQLGAAIKKGIVDRFNQLLEATGYLSKAFKMLFEGDFKGAMDVAKVAGREFVDVLSGQDDTLEKVSKGVGDAVDNIKDYAKEVKETATAIQDLENASLIATAENNRLKERYDREAEKLRQKRDDETLSFADRIAANEELGRVLDEQAKVMTENADLAVNLAAQQLELNDTTENRVALIEAQTEKEAILAQIEGQRSEQLINKNALEKEMLEEKETREEAAFQKEKARIIMRNKALQQAADKEIEIERKKAQKKAEIALAVANVLSGILGDSLAAQIAMIAAETAIQVIAVKSAASAAAAKNLAAATAAAPPPLNLPLIATAVKQNIGLGVQAAKSIGGILASGGIKALGAFTSSIGKNIKGDTKFERGGILSGPSHANGGIPMSVGGVGGFEAEGGEAIINKRSTAMFAPLLSEINAAGGGVKFNNGGLLGTASNPVSNATESLTEAIREGFASAPAPRVAVDEFAEVANNVQTIENAAEF